MKNNRKVLASNLRQVRTTLSTALKQYLEGQLPESEFVALFGRQMERLGALAESVRPKGE